MSPELRNKEEKRAFEPQKSARAQNFQKKQGDWLVDGKRHYGDGLYKVAERIIGYDERTLEDFKQISDRFEFTLRNVNLSYNHHKQVASLKSIEIISDKKLKQGAWHTQESVADVVGVDRLIVTRLIKDVQNRQMSEMNKDFKPFIYY